MKSVIVLCTIASVLLGTNGAHDHSHDHSHDHDHSHGNKGNSDNILLVEEQKLHHIHDACQADPATNADHALLHDLSANLDNPQVGAHMLCESKGVGLQKPNGELDPEVIRDKISLSIDDAAKVDRLVKECAIPKNSPEKTAIHLFMCLDKNGVTYFHEF